MQDYSQLCVVPHRLAVAMIRRPTSFWLPIRLGQASRTITPSLLAHIILTPLRLALLLPPSRH